eukprot:g33005.t1
MNSPLHDHLSGDAAARNVFEKFSGRLMALAEHHLSQKLKRRVDGDDIVQSVFRTFFARSARGEFQVDASNDLWQLLVSITLAKVRSQARRHAAAKRDVRAESGDDPEWLARTMSSEPSAEDALMLVEQLELLLSSLPEKYAEILHLRLNGESRSDIAGVLGISRQTVDLDRRWSDGEQVTVEDYLRDVPLLGTVETVSAQLLLAEYIVRKSAGERNVSKGLIRRFPKRAAELKRLIQQGRPGESISRRISQARETQSGKSDTQSVAQQAVPESARNAQPESNAGKQSGEIPVQFGRYNILRQLGQGAMGAVFLAEDTQLQRQVALKTPSFKGTDSDELIDRFYREAHAAANLRHANICPVYDVGEIDGRHFITMAYIEGRELSSFIKPDEPTAERPAAMLIRKLALALQSAHETGTVHRDLKPSNIMIDRRREPIIMDFGLARKLDTSEESRATQQGMMLGTPAYMSPEQVDGDLDAGEQSDVYSLGVILYELLTGRLPFEGSIASIIGQKLVNDPPRPSEFRPDLDPTLEAICLKMMARSREERYASMAEAAAALTDYLRQSRSEATPPVRQTNDEDGLQALFQAVGEEQNSIAPSKHVPSRLLSDRWKALSPAAKWSALGGLAALVVLSVVLLVRRPDGGILRIEVDDPNLTVLLDGDELTLTDKTWEGKKKDQKHKLAVKVGNQTLSIGSLTTITLNDGRTVTHKLTLMLNGAELSSDSFEIVRGKTTVVKISLQTSTPRKKADSKIPPDNKGNRWPGNAPPIAVAPFDAATAKKHQQVWADYLGVPVEREIVIGKKKDGHDVKITMVFIPPGEFMMGSSKKVQDHWLNDAIAAKSRWSIQHISSEGPRHRVRITKPFYLGKYEVTQAQWQELMTTDPSRFKNNPTHPVERVNWREIQAFLTKLRAQESTVEGLSFVLPTEAQWEYACRAGTTTNWYEGDSEKDLQRCGWFGANANRTTHPVGGLKPNAFGLYDMHGNVFERMSGLYGPIFAGSNPTRTAALQIEKEKQHTVGVRVIIEGKQVRITGTAEGKPLFDWTGESSRLGAPFIYRRYGQNSLLDCWGPGKTTFHRIRWRALPKAKIGKSSPPPQAGTDGWISLFNGTTLDGWKGRDDLWTVHNRQLVGSSNPTMGIKKNQYLVSSRTYRDFEMQFEVKLTGQRANSGLQIRSALIAPTQNMRGPQVDMGGPTWWGSLYEEMGRGMLKQADGALVKRVVRPDDFNAFSVKCVGKHVMVAINGTTLIDQKFPNIPDEGLLGWQLHRGPAMTATFRNIRLRELDGNGQPLTKGEARTKTPARSQIDVAIAEIKQKLIDHVNAGKAGNPPDQKKIDAFVNAELAVIKRAGKLPANLALKFRVTVNKDGKVVSVGAGIGFGGGTGGAAGAAPKQKVPAKG